eukprot:GHVN01051329.1.p2 GENE.GHVN01051329.1~~GHVN01051329.1.p2  ORF type:complete len:598 (-),score=143.22 GHVN01051329.1:2662-4455(-)
MIEKANESNPASSFDKALNCYNKIEGKENGVDGINKRLPMLPTYPNYPNDDTLTQMFTNLDKSLPMLPMLEEATRIQLKQTRARLDDAFKRLLSRQALLDSKSRCLKNHCKRALFNWEQLVKENKLVDETRAALTDVQKRMHETHLCIIGGAVDDLPVAFQVQDPIEIGEKQKKEREQAKKALEDIAKEESELRKRQDAFEVKRHELVNGLGADVEKRKQFNLKQMMLLEHNTSRIRKEALRLAKKHIRRELLNCCEPKAVQAQQGIWAHKDLADLYQCLDPYTVQKKKNLSEARFVVNPSLQRQRRRRAGLGSSELSKPVGGSTSKSTTTGAIPLMSDLVAIKPDDPNSYAFWLNEGRFRDKRLKEKRIETYLEDAFDATCSLERNSMGRKTNGEEDQRGGIKQSKDGTSSAHDHYPPTLMHKQLKKVDVSLEGYGLWDSDEQQERQRARGTGTPTLVCFTERKFPPPKSVPVHRKATHRGNNQDDTNHCDDDDEDRDDDGSRFPRTADEQAAKQSQNQQRSSSSSHLRSEKVMRLTGDEVILPPMLPPGPPLSPIIPKEIMRPYTRVEWDNVKPLNFGGYGRGDDVSVSDDEISD